MLMVIMIMNDYEDDGDNDESMPVILDDQIRGRRRILVLIRVQNK